MGARASSYAAMRDAADRDPERFWREAADLIGWFRAPDRALEVDAPSFRWFRGGRTNLAYNALDAHVAAGRSAQPALIAVDEGGGRKTLTYDDLLTEVRRVASGLRAAGVGRGDRVTIYMPTCVEAIAAMLATVRIGAIHSVVFAGFGHAALGDRIAASGSRLVLTTDMTVRKGRTVPLLPIVEAAVKVPGGVERVIVLRRDRDAAAPEGLFMDWEDFLAAGEGSPDTCEEMEANDPAFILATSGTTARPKLAVHCHGGYQVHIVAMARWCFGLRPEEMWWSTSDIGWVVGHGYIVYAPLITGATTIAFEGALDHPGPERFWDLLEDLGVNGLFTSPTAVRALMRYGDEVARRHDLARLERVFCAGEVLNAPAWEWLQRTIFEDRVPVIDHMWQTETGGPIFGNPYGLGLLPIKPGSSGPPLPGIAAAVVDADGRKLPVGEKGIMVLQRPFPGLIASLWGEPERYATDYWERIPGVYYTGDAAHLDEDGYAWFAGRADEIIKIAGHRIGTIEVETAFLHHAAVAEAGVTGRPDDVRGEVISAFVVLKADRVASDALRDELLATVRDHLGPVAVIGEITFVGLLPKTRSGKIMRRVLKAVALERDPGDITTIEDEGSVEEARAALAELNAGIPDGA
ncbi:MAG: acetate--CoA ligase [Chloroflexota bacterium]|nr:acetate--CoA ligase [Chloroflexota bacterium]